MVPFDGPNFGAVFISWNTNWFRRADPESPPSKSAFYLSSAAGIRLACVDGPVNSIHDVGQGDACIVAVARLVSLWRDTCNYNVVLLRKINTKVASSTCHENPIYDSEVVLPRPNIMKVTKYCTCQEYPTLRFCRSLATRKQPEGHKLLHLLQKKSNLTVSLAEKT